MFLLQLICLYKLPSCCLWKKLIQHLLGVFLVLLSPVRQCSLCLVGRWPQPSSFPEFPENGASGTLQCRRWRILITFLEILFFHTTIMFSKKEKWIQICIFFMGLLGIEPWRKEFIGPPWVLGDRVLSVFPNQKGFALELLCIYLFSVPLVLHPTNTYFLCELFLIWNMSLWTSAWDQKFSFLISLWGPTSLVEWIWYQRGNWERQDILCDAMQGCISFCMHVF